LSRAMASVGMLLDIGRETGMGEFSGSGGVQL